MTIIQTNFICTAFFKEGSKFAKADWIEICIDLCNEPVDEDDAEEGLEGGARN